ncbi:hypothetical protein GGF32_007629, partial [Allomyces javanicus]
FEEQFETLDEVGEYLSLPKAFFDLDDGAKEAYIDRYMKEKQKKLRRYRFVKDTTDQDPQNLENNLEIKDNKARINKIGLITEALADSQYAMQETLEQVPEQLSTLPGRVIDALNRSVNNPINKLSGILEQAQNTAQAIGDNGGSRNGNGDNGPGLQEQKMMNNTLKQIASALNSTPRMPWDDTPRIVDNYFATVPRFRKNPPPYNPELLAVSRDCFIHEVDEMEAKLKEIAMLQDPEKRDFTKHPGTIDNILIVLDDIAGTKFALQLFKAISPLARNNMSYYVLFETYNKNELRTIYDACGGPFTWEEFLAVCNEIFATPHATLNINMQNPGVRYRYNNSFHSFIMREQQQQEDEYS